MSLHLLLQNQRGFSKSFDDGQAREMTQELQSQDAIIRPRAPYFLRGVPSQYYNENQIASVVQAVEAALLSLCFCQYPQAFMTMYSGLEKLCKNIAGFHGRKNFWESWKAAGSDLGLLSHELFEKEIRDGKEQFIVQSEWSILRNKIEHLGDSPSYDLRSARLLLGTLWDAYELLLNKGYDFDLRGSLLLETRTALDYTKVILSTVERQGGPKDTYFVKPLLAHMRTLVQPTFFPWEFDYEQYFNSSQRFENLMRWQEDIKRKRPDLAWQVCCCPVCKSAEAIAGMIEGGDDDTLVLEFDCFQCPKCGLHIGNHETEPHHAATVLSYEMNRLGPAMANDVGSKTYKIVS
jgi:hypothetical protein